MKPIDEIRLLVRGIDSLASKLIDGGSVELIQRILTLENCLKLVLFRYIGERKDD